MAINWNVFARGELTNHANWISRVFTPLAALFTAYWGTLNTYTAITLTSPWTQSGRFSNASYRVRHGHVHVFGELKSTSSSLPQTMFTLPVGVRPLAPGSGQGTVQFPAFSGTGNVTITCDSAGNFVAAATTAGVAMTTAVAFSFDYQIAY